MSFLRLTGKTILVVGVANRKSVAHFVGKTLLDEGCVLHFSVRDEETLTKCQRLYPESTFHLCDVEKEEEIAKLATTFKEQNILLDGLVHSIAFADYSEGIKSFHETKRSAFLQAVQISCFSLVELVNALKDNFNNNASVVTLSISTTTMAAEPYGFMGPVKGALDSTVVFLAKSFSTFSKIRFNGVKAGLLKTSSSAGIPGYIDYYLFAEQATLRREALKTSEVADVVAWLLSERSSGINAQGIVVDAGMYCNYFDKEIVKQVSADL